MTQEEYLEYGFPVSWFVNITDPSDEKQSAIIDFVESRRDKRIGFSLRPDIVKYPIIGIGDGEDTLWYHAQCADDWFDGYRDAELTINGVYDAIVRGSLNGTKKPKKSSFAHFMEKIEK